MTRTDIPFDERFDCVLHAAPLWLIADHLRALAGLGVARIVALGSTSVETKEYSRNVEERRVSSMLARAEERITQQARQLDIATTLFRPTMIYGYGRDANVSTIARFIRKFGFFPVAGAASGKRQPIHADDVGKAMVSAMGLDVPSVRIYYLAGGETLTYREMAGRIFDCLERKRRIVTLPEKLYSALLDAASRVGAGVSGSMATRMNLDLVFDTSATTADLDFHPGNFLENPQRDLPA
jgi:nucleoside-diphosphate-sugar epimerase